MLFICICMHTYSILNLTWCGHYVMWVGVSTVTIGNGSREADAFEFPSRHYFNSE